MLSLRLKRIALVLMVFVALPIAAVVNPADAGARNLLATSPSPGTAASYSILVGSSGESGLAAVELSPGGVRVCSDSRPCLTPPLSNPGFAFLDAVPR